MYCHWIYMQILKTTQDNCRVYIKGQPSNIVRD